MSTYDYFPPGMLARALSQVTGELYDETTPEGQTRIAKALRELQPDSELIVANALASMTPRPEQLHYLKRLPDVRYRISEDEYNKNISDEELPSRAVSLPNIILSKDNLVSPKSLGWENLEYFVWSPKLTSQWTNFIKAAEVKITSHHHEHLHFIPKTFLTEPPIFHSEHRAKNYDLVMFKSGREKTTAHFVFGTTHVYFVVFDLKNKETHRAKVAVDNVSRFSDEIEQAYKGSAELAKGALNHLLSAFVL
jgi:hypothetical protein